ncbi:MAG: MoaD/ThiS family protein [Phycisphaerae bacterium]|nr:MoaD/ThiS family protein [Phycisphaerae bacterium]
MNVCVRLFGAEASAAGLDSITVDVDEPPTCRGVVDAVGRACPALAALLPGVRVALNAEFAPPERPVRPEDEVALIGLVSGG